MDTDQLHRDADKAALEYYAKILKNPKQLEKIKQLKTFTSFKKNVKEEVLETEIKNQLDGITLGMEKLRQAIDDAVEVKTLLNQTKQSLTALPTLDYELKGVRSTHIQHSEFTTASENIKHLFSISDNIEKAKQWIKEGKLLHAHQCLVELEQSRDEILLEIRKLPNQTIDDILLLNSYFKNVKNVSDMMEKKIKLILSRTLNTVRKEPTEIVTVLRLIEREERSDKIVLEQRKLGGYLPPDRPKKWKQMCFDTLCKSVDQRIEGAKANERSDSKIWLVTYLEVIRLLIIEDLRVVKFLCVPCFPPKYNIFEQYVKMYHASLSSNLEKIISKGLIDNEYLTIMSWVTNTYTGTELMKHPELNVDISKVGPLLTSTVFNDLQTKYLEFVEINYKEWMFKTLEVEKNDWYNNVLPEVEQDGYFHTSTPVIIFQMTNQNLQLVNTIDQHLTHNMLLLSMSNVIRYGSSYTEAVIDFKKTYFEDRSKVPFFTRSMVAVLNNCLRFLDLALAMKQNYGNSYFQEQTSTVYENVKKTFQNLQIEATKCLLEEVFLDLAPHVQNLITTNWLTSFISIETICITLEDYFQDYLHLKPNNLEYIVLEAEDMLVERYITAMLQKKLTFKTYNECHLAADKIIKEVNQLKSLFLRLVPLEKRDKNSSLNAIIKLSDVLKCKDSEIISLDLHTLINAYPDITKKQMTRLLKLRGDFKKSEIRERVKYAIKSNLELRRTTLIKSIFQKIQL